MLPWLVRGRGGLSGFELSLWVFGLPPGEEAPVVGSRGVVSSFQYQPSNASTPPLAQELEVETSGTGGSFSLSFNDVTSNEIVGARPQPPRTPQLVPWRVGTGAVLIVAERFGSGRLVTAEGQALPDASWTCERAPDELAAVAMLCTVVRGAPLQVGGFSGSAVRAVVDAPGGPLLTRPVRLP